MPLCKRSVLILSVPQSSADFALDALSGDFVASSAAPTLKSSSVPTETAPQVNTQAYWSLFGSLLLSTTLHFLNVFCCALSCQQEQTMLWTLCQTP